MSAHSWVVEGPREGEADTANAQCKKLHWVQHHRQQFRCQLNAELHVLSQLCVYSSTLSSFYFYSQLHSFFSYTVLLSPRSLSSFHCLRLSICLLFFFFSLFLFSLFVSPLHHNYFYKKIRNYFTLFFTFILSDNSERQDTLSFKIKSKTLV